MMNKRRSFLTGLLGLGSLSSVKIAAASKGRGGGLQLFFAYRDVVTKFSPTGLRISTAIRSLSSMRVAGTFSLRTA